MAAKILLLASVWVQILFVSEPKKGQYYFSTQRLSNYSRNTKLMQTKSMTSGASKEKVFLVARKTKFFF
jgi:hypothetical protein